VQNPTKTAMISKNPICLAPLLLALSLSAAFPAEVFHVSPQGSNSPPFASWESAAHTIQDAVDAASGEPGATVLVRKGTYTSAGEEAVVKIKVPVTLRGESGKPEDVVIDGRGKRRGIHAALTSSGAPLVIEGLTVTNGFANGNGGGILLDHSKLQAGAAEIRNCVLTGNQAGKGIRLRGGGLASIGGGESDFRAGVRDTRFAGNVARGRDSRGGGAAFFNTSVEMNNCVFEENRSEGDAAAKQGGFGGGASVEGTPEGSMLRAVTFRDNVALCLGDGGGGGLAIFGEDTHLEIVDCVFENNRASYGCGLMQLAGRLVLRNTRVINAQGTATFWQNWGDSWRPEALLVDSWVQRFNELRKHGVVEVVDTLRDPTVFRDPATGKFTPVSNPGQARQRRLQTLERIKRLAGPLPDREQLPPPAIEVIKDEVLEDGVRRQLIEYAVGDGAPRVKAWLLAPTAECLDPSPAQRKTRAGVLCLHQTNRKIGKNEPAGLDGDPNMHYAIELARRGFVTLAPDFTGSGEHPNLGTFENGFQSATMKGVSDHMRALDVLAALPVVDPERIGCIGHSLGGFNTIFVTAFDPRIKAAVSSCGFVGWQAYEDREGSLYLMAQGNYMPHIRNYRFKAALLPFDFHEVVGACAPRALFLNGPLRDDPFLAEGVREILAANRPLYERLGAGEALLSEHPDTGHSFPPEVRSKAYAFLESRLGVPHTQANPPTSNPATPSR
jgi:hypothetical protein